MKKLKLLLAVILVGILVALTYYVFEYAVHHSINYIWNTVFDTANKRYLVIPLAVVGALLFFGFQHLLDPKSEGHEAHGLGGITDVSLKKLGIVLFIGYFSLVGGASLGPEAILVPSSMIIGSYLGLKLFNKNELATKALMAAGIMALFAAFFHSWVVGILSISLVTKQAKTKITPQLALIAFLAAGASFLTLKVIDPTNSYFNTPDYNLHVILVDMAAGVILLAAGYASTFALKFLHGAFDDIRANAKNLTWWKLAIAAGLGLSLFYLLGGPLVEFTGNESVAPMFAQAPSLGVWSVILILVCKLLAISWSKAMGYRGGLIFPMVFVASTLVALTQFAFHDLNIGIGTLAALIGILAAERKAKILL